jgi:predicted phage baseplate assembly protein
VFALDAEAGLLRFGDGVHGRRPAADAGLSADYDYSVGAAGNVGAGAIRGGPTLPPGFTAANPVRTWGGADAESVGDGERQVSRYLQHRERLVSAEDFATIARRAPGADVARVDVLAAYDPFLAPNEPGDAPGAVTVVVVPSRDQRSPDAPSPDRFTLEALRAHLDPRRLVTTELFLRGPDYVPIWISVGIDVTPGSSIAEVRTHVTAALRQILSPLPSAAQPGGGDAFTPPYPHADGGWPLRTAVSVAELTAYVTRVAGVRLVNGLRLAKGVEAERDRIELSGLELPRIAGCVVGPGATPLADLRGATPAVGPPKSVPVPVLPEAC